MLPYEILIAENVSFQHSSSSFQMFIYHCCQINVKHIQCCILTFLIANYVIVTQKTLLLHLFFLTSITTYVFSTHSFTTAATYSPSSHPLSVLQHSLLHQLLLPHSSHHQASPRHFPPPFVPHFPSAPSD